MIFVTSWDDGHPLDERLGTLLDSFGLRGTFFVPIGNREGRPVLSPRALRELDARFEIGSHTRDHVPLTEVSREECRRQVVEGKDALEQRLGHAVGGFCYPRGKWNRAVREEVVKAGFRYARSIENLRLDPGHDRFALPTSMQAYPHPRRVLWRNYLKHGRYLSRSPALGAALAGKEWTERFARMLEACREDDVLHLWGHSWEIDEQNLWEKLGGLFELVASRQPKCLTIDEVVTGREFGKTL